MMGGVILEYTTRKKYAFILLQNANTEYFKSPSSNVYLYVTVYVVFPNLSYHDSHSLLSTINFMSDKKKRSS